MSSLLLEEAIVDVRDGFSQYIVAKKYGVP